MTREEIMLHNIQTNTVGLDDTFKFHCAQCGKCCTYRDDIILSPMDIFKIARELKIVVRVVLYLQYDTSKDFLPQFKNNTEHLMKLLDDIPKLKGMVRHGRIA